MKKFNIGTMEVTIEGKQVTTNHPTNEMKNCFSMFEISPSLRTGEMMVVLKSRFMENNQSESALKRIKKEILKEVSKVESNAESINSHVQSFPTQSDMFKKYKEYSFMNCESFGEAVRNLKIYGNDEATIISQLKGTHSEFRSVIIFIEDSEQYFVNTCRV